MLGGSYQDGYILTGPSRYESSQKLNNSDIVYFDTVSQVQTSGPGIYEESTMLHSCGAAASGVTCGVDSIDADGANFKSVPYCETVVVNSLFMSDDLVFARLVLFPRQMWRCQIHLLLRVLDRGRVPDPSALVRGVWQGLGITVNSVM